MHKRLKEIEARKAEIRGILESGAEFNAEEISKELESLSIEERGILDKLDLIQRAQTNPTLVTPVGGQGAEGRGGLSPAEERMHNTRATKEYRSAYYKMFQYGRNSLNDEERNTLMAGNAISNGRNLPELRFTSDSASAGAAIPTITLDLVIEKLLVVSAVYPFISKYNIKGNLKVPYENVTQDAAWTSEGTVITPGSDTIAGLSLGAYDLIKLVKISRVVEQLSVDAFEAYIVDKLFRKLMIAIENAVLNGTGTTMPTGILNAITWISSGAGKNQLIYGSAGASLASLTYDNFTGAKGLLPAPYHPMAYWIMSANTLYSGVCGIKDALGRPIFLENPQWGLTSDNGDGKQVNYNQSAVVGRILGSPVIMSPYLADGTVVLGDLRFYHFNMSVDVLVEKSFEAGFTSNDVYYKGWLLGDGGVSQQEAFVKMTPHA